MAWFHLFTLFASLTQLELLRIVSASPAVQPRGDSPAAAPAQAPAQGAVLSSKAQSLVDSTVKVQKGTGLKWDLLAAEALLTLVKDVQKNGWQSKTCTLDDVYVRREWGTFSKQERKDYIKAVQCLQKRPSRLNPKDFPGAKNRYDDFVAVHIQQTLSIHVTANFLTWHRYFTWAYEQTLRNECGYKGYQPYYNWATWAQDPLKSPVFDGSDTSMSGDGTFFPHGNVELPPFDPGVILPPQNGGGCIFSGPFVNWTVNLGPVPFGGSPPYVKPNPREDGLGYNPRCIIRDISKYVSSRWTRDIDVYDLIVKYTNIKSFQDRLQGDQPNGFLGVHGGGHYTSGGDPGGDFFASPGDPYFFLHHSAIDRLYWTWQNLAPQSRYYVIAGTLTFNNTPPSREGTLDDPIDMSVLNLAGVLKIRNTVSTLGGGGSPFCYIYA